MSLLSKIIVCVFVVSSFFVKAQRSTSYKIDSVGSIGIFGLIPFQDCGGGAGFNFFLKPFKFNQITYKNSLQMRIGAEFYVSKLHKIQLDDILLDNNASYAKCYLKHNANGINLVTRFSLLNSKRISPFIDLFAGYRSLSTSITIMPNVVDTIHESVSNQSLTKIHQLNYGGTLGFDFNFSQRVSLNTGIMLTTSNFSSDEVKILKSYVDQGVLYLTKEPSRKEIWYFKVGFKFSLYKKVRTPSSTSNGTSPKNPSSSNTSAKPKTSTAPSKPKPKPKAKKQPNKVKISFDPPPPPPPPPNKPVDN